MARLPRNKPRGDICAVLAMQPKHNARLSRPFSRRQRGCGRYEKKSIPGKEEYKRETPLSGVCPMMVTQVKSFKFLLANETNRVEASEDKPASRATQRFNSLRGKLQSLLLSFHENQAINIARLMVPSRLMLLVFLI